MNIFPPQISCTEQQQGKSEGFESCELELELELIYFT